MDINIIGFTVRNIKIKKNSHKKNSHKKKAHMCQNKHNINEYYYDNSDFYIHPENNHSKDNSHKSKCNNKNIITIKISKHNFVSSSLGNAIICENAWEIYKKNIYNYIHIPFILTFIKKYKFNSMIFKLIKIKCYKKYDFIKLYLECNNSHIDNHKFLHHRFYDNIRFRKYI